MISRRSAALAEKGFSLIETLIAVSLSVVGIVVLASLISELAKSQQRAALQLGLSEIRLSFQMALTRQADWQITVQQNPGMHCFSAPPVLTSPGSSNPVSGGYGVAGCANVAVETPPSGNPFQLFKAQVSTPTASASPAGASAGATSATDLSTPVTSGVSGVTLYDSASTTSGFTINGSPCNTFPTGGCVVKPSLVWKLQCAGAAMDPGCQSPLVIVNLIYNMDPAQGPLSYRGTSLGATTNLSSYGFHLVIPTYPLQTKAPCSTPIPTCPSAAEPIVCVNGTWQCEEFGL